MQITTVIGIFLLLPTLPAIQFTLLSSLNCVSVLPATSLRFEIFQDMSNVCSINAQPLPKELAFKLAKWDNRQNVAITFQQLSFASVHQLGHFVARDKMGHFVGWDNLSAKKCQWDNGLLMDMPEILPKIYPKYARDTRKLCSRYGSSN